MEKICKKENWNEVTYCKMMGSGKNKMKKMCKLSAIPFSLGKI